MLHQFSWVILLLMFITTYWTVAGSPDFIFNGFLEGELILNGAAKIEPSGRLHLTESIIEEVGRAFYPYSIPFLNASGFPCSFSTSFVFVIVPHYSGISSEGLAFAISPSPNMSSAGPSQYLGLLNLTSNGQNTSHVVAIELDTVRNNDLNETDDNQVGIDVNSLESIASAPASFYTGSSSFQNLSLISSQPIRVWADYDSNSMTFNVTIGPVDIPKPDSPLLSTIVNLSSVFSDNMYVGFSASTGTAPGSHYILGWSFSLNGIEKELVLSNLPFLSQVKHVGKLRKVPVIWATIGALMLLIIALTSMVLALKRKRKLSEVSEEWEKGYISQRFSYRDVHRATGGFSHRNLLGGGGFGEVYKGVLGKDKKEVAVKRISHGSKQGMKEFVAEIASIGRLRHRNLVQLIGYVRRRGKLILVYDYMPKGSLDKYLFFRAEETLTWKQRFNIIKDIAAGLLYLHEEWEQVVLHRDIKASNVLLDADFNGKLGDFGLAKLHDRGSVDPTTRVVGTPGYLAPELWRTGKSTTSSDVFAFGAFLLEVACGKRPLHLKMTGVEMVLVDWVMEFMKKGQLLEARDRRLGDNFVAEEVELVLKLGLMCSLPAAVSRPGMKQVSRYLEGEAALPEMTTEDFNTLDMYDANLYNAALTAPAQPALAPPAYRRRSVS